MIREHSRSRCPPFGEQLRRRVVRRNPQPTRQRGRPAHPGVEPQLHPDRRPARPVKAAESRGPRSNRSVRRTANRRRATAHGARQSPRRIVASVPKSRFQRPRSRPRRARADRHHEPTAREAIDRAERLRRRHRPAHHDQRHRRRQRHVPRVLHRGRKSGRAVEPGHREHHVVVDRQGAEAEARQQSWCTPPDGRGCTDARRSPSAEDERRNPRVPPPQQVRLDVPDTPDWHASWIEPIEPPDAPNAPRRVPPGRRGHRRWSGRVRVPARDPHTVYEAFVNGNRVGTAELSPGSTSYDKTVYAQAADVAPSLTR